MKTNTMNKTPEVNVFPSRTEIADIIQNALEFSVELQDAIAEEVGP